MPSPTSVVAGRYVLSEQVGSGGMGVVWRGYDELLQRQVAVKELHFPPHMSPEERERLARRTLREARAVAAVDDPSAVRVFDIVEQDGRPWIVMEYLDGMTLTDVIRERGPLPAAEVIHIGQALVNALEAAHTAGVLHRDVKPSNVMIAPDGRVALTDFGIATSIDGESGDTTSGVIVGSPAYMAPERARGEPPTAASDLWSLGATLWTAAEGRPPFEGPTGLATMTAVATEPPPRCARCAGPLGDLLHRLMDRDAAARPPLDDVRRELSALVETAPRRVVAADPYPTEPLPAAFDRTTALDPIVDRPAAAKPAAPGRSRRGLGWLVAALVGLIVLAAVSAAVVLGGKGGTSAGKKSPPASTSTTGSGAASSSAALPTGWHRFRNGNLGWSIGVPPGWQIRDEGDTATISDPAGGRYVRVDTRYPAGPSALGAWQDQERAFRGSHPAYQRIKLADVSYGSYRQAADWEFTFTSGQVTLHALDRGFISSGNRGYAIYFQTHDDQWSSSADLLQGFLSSFRP
ncbi:MAG TPA: serine/threonine-protein kinase [Mycobacteriales bacterium]|jgi:tRNA A-37 threonylcarbamoyl transferase component Bud32|nr:serine/threonine-protein kinase [Mycobacteriales bacterium]